MWPRGVASDRKSQQKNENQNKDVEREIQKKEVIQGEEKCMNKIEFLVEGLLYEIIVQKDKVAKL